MSELKEFKEWVGLKLDISPNSVKDIVSRFRRANKILPFYNDPVYVFYLENTDEYKKLAATVRSQIKRAIHLYMDWLRSR